MHDLLIQIIFYLVAGVALASALMVITQNNPVRCVLFLVLTFFACALLWIIVSAEFLALILVLVYVGAVMTLFLFVVMMLNIDTESIKSHLMRYLPFGLILVALLIGLLLIAVPEKWYALSVEQKVTSQQTTHLAESTLQGANNDNDVAKLSNTEVIGLALFTEYVYAFELAAVLLLVAIVAAITLTHRTVLRSKRQDITQQIMTRGRDRIRLVSLKSEKP